MINFSTRILGSGIQQITNAQPIRVPIESNAPQAQFIIGNLSDLTTAAVLYVCDTSGKEAVPVFAQQAITLETDSSFTIKSSSASVTNYVLGQLIVRGLGLAESLATSTLDPGVPNPIRSGASPGIAGVGFLGNTGFGTRSAQVKEAPKQ